MARTPDAGLHFVKNQQRIILITKLAQTLQKGFVRRQHAAFALNRFDNHRASMIVNHGFYRIQIIERNMDNIGRFRPETVGIFRLSADADGK